MDPPLHVSTSDPPKDIFSEPPADPVISPPNKTNADPDKAAGGGLSKGPVAAEEPDDLFSDPLGESGAPVTGTKSESLLHPVEEPAKSDFVKKASAGVKADGSTVVSAPQNDVVKKSQKDVFEEPVKGKVTKPPTDIFSEPKSGAVSGKKPASSDLFGDDDDEDLFKEPLGAVTKKPEAPLFTETNAASNARSERPNDAPADLFTEEAFTVNPPPAAAPAATAASAKPSVNTSSKTNGLHSDEEDLFAGIQC